jgi:hypothetical protein
MAMQDSPTITPSPAAPADVAPTTPTLTAPPMSSDMLPPLPTDRPPTHAEVRERSLAHAQRALSGPSAPAPTAPAAPASTTTATTATPPAPQPTSTAPDVVTLQAHNAALQAELAALKAKLAPTPTPAPPKATPATAPATAPTTEATPTEDQERQRLIENPTYAQVVGLFGKGLPDHLVHEATTALKVRAQWQPYLNHEQHGATAAQRVLDADARLDRVSYEAETRRLLAAQQQQQQPQDAWTTVSRIEKTSELVSLVAAGTDPTFNEVFGGVSVAELYAIAASTPGATAEDWFNAVCDRVEAVRARAPAAAPSAPAPMSPPGNPAPPPPLEAPTMTSGSWLPKDRPPTLHEIVQRVHAANSGRAN